MGESIGNSRKKDGTLRLCLDPRALNKAIRRSHFQFPTFDDIISKINGAKYFAKLDAYAGYWMLPLEEDSSKLCTFQTPFGRYKFKRLPFGLNCSAEIFHRKMSQLFETIEGVIIYQDDFLIVAKTKEELRAIIEKVLRKAKENGIKFNLKKCQFYMEKLTFLV